MTLKTKKRLLTIMALLSLQGFVHVESALAGPSPAAQQEIGLTDQDRAESQPSSNTAPEPIRFGPTGMALETSGVEGLLVELILLGALVALVVLATNGIMWLLVGRHKEAE